MLPFVKNPKRELYGRNKGHKLSIRQNELMSSLLPELRLDVHSEKKIHSYFPGSCSEVWMEIGFGGGEHLAWLAEKNPDVAFIGCEPFVNGVAKLLTVIDDQGLKNIRIFDDDARIIMEWLPSNIIDKLYILFPDPWPKKRHRKRRLISAETLSLMSKVLKPGAKVHFATDIDDYVKTALLSFTNDEKYNWLDDCAADWKEYGEKRPLTRYESKALSAGRKPVYLSFECNK